MSYTPLSNPRIILDTDVNGDMDDAGTIMMLFALERLGECSVQAIIVNDTCQWGAPSVDALRRWNGRADVPIGRTDRSGLSCQNAAYQALYAGTSGYRAWTTSTVVPDAVDVARQALHDAPDGSVVWVGVGFFNNLHDVIASPADSIDSRSGADLFAAKVHSCCIMATNNSGTFEFNTSEIFRDLASEVTGTLTTMGVPIVWSPFQVGHQVQTPKDAHLLSANHPTRIGYANFSGGKEVDGSASFDQTALHVAVRGTQSFYALERGTMVIPASGTTHSTWAVDQAGPHWRMSIEAGQVSAVESEISGLMKLGQVVDPDPGPDPAGLTIRHDGQNVSVRLRHDGQWLDSTTLVVPA